MLGGKTAIFSGLSNNNVVGVMVDGKGFVVMESDARVKTDNIQRAKTQLECTRTWD